MITFQTTSHVANVIPALVIGCDHQANALIANLDTSNNTHECSRKKTIRLELWDNYLSMISTWLESPRKIFLHKHRTLWQTCDKMPSKHNNRSETFINGLRAIEPWAHVDPRCVSSTRGGNDELSNRPIPPTCCRTYHRSPRHLVQWSFHSFKVYLNNEMHEMHWT